MNLRKKKKAKELMENFQENLRKFRKGQKLTQEEVAKRSTLNISFVGGIERGDKQPALTSVIKLADALDVHPSCMLSREEEGLQGEMKKRLQKRLYHILSEMSDDRKLLLYEMLAGVGRYLDRKKD